MPLCCSGWCLCSSFTMYHLPCLGVHDRSASDHAETRQRRDPTRGEESHGGAANAGQAATNSWEEAEQWLLLILTNLARHSVAISFDVTMALYRTCEFLVTEPCSLASSSHCTHTPPSVPSKQKDVHKTGGNQPRCLHGCLGYSYMYKKSPQIHKTRGRG